MTTATSCIDRQAKIQELEAQLAKLKVEIKKEEKLEEQWRTLERAYSKLKKELGKTLTNEEYNTIDGAYLFLHGGCVDLIRKISSATDKGESKRLEKVLAYGETLAEVREIEAELRNLR